MAHSITDLNELYQKSESALQSHFAEIRTNILLDTGFHHPKSERLGQSRMFSGVSKQKRIRITQNHTAVITKTIRNSIQNRAPDGGIFPRNEKELADQKAAELNSSVYAHVKSEEDLTSFYGHIVHDLVVQGETHTKVFYDPEGGRFLGYEETAEEDDENEDPKDDEGGSPMKVIRMDRRKPRFAGRIVFERIPAYNFLTDPNADSQRTCMWVCIRKFMPRKQLEYRYMGQADKLEIIKKSGKDKKDWFDGFTGIYKEEGSDEVEIREYYFKSCHEYPEGYYYFATDHGILEKGELPDGFCIFSEVYDESPENPRGYSVIKAIKPYQIEINRAAAAAITESITLGHSTVMYPAGEKPTSTGIGNGIKGLAYNSVQPPIVVPGVTGQNYLDYLQQKVEEMYRVAQVPFQDEEKQSGGANDGQAMLGRALRDKMKFSIYGEKVERLICKIIDYTLKLARRHLPDDEVIPIVGKNEAVNIAEFRNTTPAMYQIKIEPRSDDFTNVYGKSLQIVQALQYVGQQLPPEALAAMIDELPFLNKSNLMKDFRVWKDQGDAIILSLDRGEIPFFFPNGNHEYMTQRLSMRMNEADFPMLSKQIQMNYQERYEAHLQALTQQQQEAAAATAGHIPSGGGLVSADYYITKDGKQQRVRLPYEAVDWLVKRLATQGSDVEKINNLPLAAQADLGQMNQQAGVSSQPQAPMAPTGPGAMPMTG